MLLWGFTTVLEGASWGRLADPKASLVFSVVPGVQSLRRQEEPLLGFPKSHQERKDRSEGPSLTAGPARESSTAGSQGLVLLAWGRGSYPEGTLGQPGTWHSW